MQSNRLSSRCGAVVSLAGVALSFLGFRLPVLIESGPNLFPPGTRPLYAEWPSVPDSLWSLAADLPWLVLLVVIAASVAALFRTPSPRLVLLKWLVALGGLVIQLLWEFLFYAFAALGRVHIDPGWGLAVVPLGFVVVMIGFSVEYISQRQDVLPHR